jgi:membrane-associated phospholipid phosphatase
MNDDVVVGATCRGGRRHAAKAPTPARIAILVSCLLATSLAAQQSDSVARDTTHGPHLFTLSTGIVSGAFVAGTLIASPFDERISKGLRAGWLQHNRGLRNSADFIDDGLGSPGAILIAGGLYAGAWLAHDRPLAGVGIDLGEAVGAAGVTTELLKFITGRARPSLNPSDPGDWGLGRGFTHDGYASFPSATTTLAFALATAASVDAARAWPRTRVLLPALFYSAATAVGVSRVYRQEHWPTDVLFGAGVGAVAGLLATRFNFLHRQNIIRRLFLPSE